MASWWNATVTATIGTVRHFTEGWYRRDKHYRDFVAVLEPGDLIEFDRGVYQHWGVYVGGEEVINR